LDPSGKKGIFVGYCEVSKAFIIYIPGYHHIEVSRDVTFDENATLKRSRKCQLEEVYEEPVPPRVAEPVKEVTVTPDDEILEDNDMIESQEPPRMTISHKKASLGARTYSRCREVWCPRRNHETKQETEAILQLYGLDV
jgi:hypothetical protein